MHNNVIKLIESILYVVSSHFFSFHGKSMSMEAGFGNTVEFRKKVNIEYFPDTIEKKLK